MAYELKLTGTIPLRYLKKGGVAERLLVFLNDAEDLDLQVRIEDESIVFYDDEMSPDARSTLMRLLP